MIYFPKRSLYALEAILDIALHARPDPVCASDLTQRQKISKRSLERIMQTLVHAGILTGHRGPHGGYRLARERRRITVGEILRAIEGLDQNQKDEYHSVLNKKIIQPLCMDVRDKVMEQLDHITLEDLTHRAEKNRLSKESGMIIRNDFNI